MEFIFLMKNFREVKGNFKKKNTSNSKQDHFEDFWYRYWVMKREQKRYCVQFYLLLMVFLYIFLLFLKTGENNFYLFSKKCSHFTLFLKNKKREQQSNIAMNFKNNFMFFKI